MALTHFLAVTFSSVCNNGLVVGFFFLLRAGGRLRMKKVKHWRHLWSRQREKKDPVISFFQLFHKKPIELLQDKLIAGGVSCLQMCVWAVKILYTCVCACPCTRVPFQCVCSWPLMTQRRAVLNAKRGRCLLFHQVAMATVRSGAAIVKVFTTHESYAPDLLTA